MENPHMEEDQTDVDFFDKLVDDELGANTSITGSHESENLDEIADEPRLVSSSLDHSLDELENAPESGTAGSSARGNVIGSLDVKTKSREESQYSSPFVSNVSGEYVDLVEDGNTIKTDAKLQVLSGKGSQSDGSGVKEVDWSSFFTDNTENNIAGFGSYSDFFAGSGHEHGGVFPKEQVGNSTSVSSESQDDFIHGKNHLNEAVNTRICSNSAGLHGRFDRVCSEKEVADKDSNEWDSNYTGEPQAYSANGEQTTNEQVEYNNKYWQNLYPGWTFDYSTGEWRQIDDHHVDNSISHATVADSLNNYQENGFPDDAGNNALSGQKSEISYFQHTPNSVAGTMAEKCTMDFISNWSRTSQCNAGYPPNWCFYEQYPGWYYDTITQQWHQMNAQFDQLNTDCTNEDHVLGHQSCDNHSSGNAFMDTNSTIASNDPCQMEEYPKQEDRSKLTEPVASHEIQNLAPTSQREFLYSTWNSIGDAPDNDSCYHQTYGHLLTDGNIDSTAENYHSDQRMHFVTPKPVSAFIQESHSYISNATKPQSLSFPNSMHGFYRPNISQGHQAFHNDVHHGKHKLNNHLKSGELSSSSSTFHDSVHGRTSEGRPLHALVTFGFAGRLVVMKVNDPFKRNFTHENQDPAGGLILIHDLMDVVDKSSGGGEHGYVSALCQQSFPGPLVGGNVASKDVHKWLDERISSSGSWNVDCKKEELLRMLLSLLKISCLHYGKLRSPFGSESSVQESDGPESAVTKLFLSARRNSTRSNEFGAYTQCLQPVPSEAHIKSTANEMQKLLVSGRRLEALQCAQEGQLWGPALVLAGKLGDKFYADTVKQMANHHFILGSPLRTLCLLIAGQPADAFSSANLTNAVQLGVVGMSHHSNEVVPKVTSTPRKFKNLIPIQVKDCSCTCGSSMLDVWEENLAIIVANRTKDDELVIIHLGDCLWKDTGEVAAAHGCYLIAETNFEMFSDTARLCLIGADHWKFPRTYASPDAIQRTEVYEYSKVLGNSQFVLQTFQPYKLIYAHMLAEVGKVSESLRYCQAILKLSKSGSRTADVETWKLLASSLEDRLRTHQQGGFSSNLAPSKLMGKVLTSIDRSIHRMISGPLPPLPPITTSSAHNNESDDHPVPNMSSGSSRMAMASLMPSASMDPICTGDNGRKLKHTRSISEPDIGRTPKQNAKAFPSDSQGKSSGSSTLFGRFGSNLLQKAVGLVSRTRQAKLGEENKFYYDEKLKKWVEKGVDPQSEAAVLASPPKTAAFQNISSYNANNTGTSQNSSLNGVSDTDRKGSPTSEHSSSIPPIPPSKNQFAQRGRVGVCSRYVDTFNKGGGSASTTIFQSPTLPIPKPSVPAQFFIPTPSTPAEAAADNSTEVAADNSTSSSSATPAPSSAISSIHRFPSMDMTPVNKVNGDLGNRKGSFTIHNRAASWSGSYAEFLGNTNFSEIGPPTEALVNPSFSSPPPGPLSAVPNSLSMSTTAATLGDDLQEVDL